jgi:hypothetical protein
MVTFRGEEAYMLRQGYYKERSHDELGYRYARL